MNGTIGRGTAVHSITGDYADCGKGMGRNAITATSAEVDCKSCLKIAPPAATPVRFEVTVQVNTLDRGWQIRKVILKGAPEWVTAKIAEMMNTANYRVLSSAKI